MGDQEARRKYAELGHQFISGRMTNDEYEERCEEITSHQDDPAVREIYHQIWFLYDDIQTHRMTGKHRLDRAGRREMAKAVLFLQGDQEYVWPETYGLMLWGCLVFLALPWAVILLLGTFTDQALWILLASAWVSVLLVCHYFKLKWQAQRRWNKTGEGAAWPFRHHADLDEAKRRPQLLNGKQ